MTDLKKLKVAIFEKEKTYADCARVIGKTVTSFCNKMNGKAPITVDEANILANYLALSENMKIAIFFPKKLA